MRLPWNRERPATAERKQAEARAELVHQEIVRPLREMRERNHLTEAIVADIRRRLKETSS